MKPGIARAFHKRFQTFLVVSLLAAPAIASAQITQTYAPGIFPSYTHRNTVAFNPVQDVYLAIVWDPPFGAPITGRFLNKAGEAITGDFAIVDEVDANGNPAFASWASIAFGGTPADPAFIVTYTVTLDGSTASKYARLVRYTAGGPTVTGRVLVADVGGQWFASEKAQSFWNGNQFVVGTRVLLPGASLPTFQVSLVDLNLNTSPGINLGDGADFYGSPAIACGNGVCLAVGFKAGVAGGYTGGTYGRLFDSHTLVPMGPAVMPLNGSGQDEEQAVVYQKHTGMFLTMWFRVSGGWIDTRLVVPDGTLGTTQTAGGPNGGTTAIAYNQYTQTTLLLTKDSAATLYALELGDDGTQIRPANVLILTNWDGAINDYLPAIGVNEEDGQWLVAYRLAGTSLGQIITGTHVDPTTVPLNVLTSSSLPAGTHTIPYAQLLLASGGVIPYTWTQVSGTLPPGIQLNGAYLSGTPTVPGTYNFRLRVTSTDAQVAERDFTLFVQAIIVVPPGGQGAHIEGGAPLYITYTLANRNNLAYDSAHGVYLMVVNSGESPIIARFLDRNGTPVGSDFLVADDIDPGTGVMGFLSWTGLTFGGPPNDPTFLITYNVGDANQVNTQKYARFIRFVPGGAPTVTGRMFIANVGQQWFAAEKAQSVWTGQHWVIGTRVLPPGFAFPTFQVNSLDMSGALSAPVNLGDGLDFYGSPAIACAPNDVCLTIGFKAGITTGYSGGTYARRFTGSSLAPLGPVFALFSGLQNEDQGVVYQTHTGNFLAQWWRGGGPGYIDTRLIGTDGSMSILDMSRGFGPGAGANTIAFNAGTRTSLLVTKRGIDAALVVMELGDDGYPLDPNNVVVITPWDGSINDFYPSIASNDGDRQWLVTARLASGTHGKIIQGSPPGTSYAVQNSTFANGLTGWSVFAQPDPGSLVTAVNNGVLYFYRPPLPPGQQGQGVVLQSLGVSLAAGVPIGADFDLGNTSAFAQRITILLHDLDFSDLQVCTFWLPANAPLRRYRMLTHTTAPWDNATISFYASSTSVDNGALALDNVRTYSVIGQPVDRTECVDPTTPGTYPFGDTPSFIANGSFTSGLAPWGTFGQITFQLSGGVFEFARPAGTPAGVVLQPTGQALPLESRLKATFQLGNSSANRRRVTVVIHDADFSDFSVCSFWLPAGQALSTYTMQFVVKKPWANATFAVYPANVDNTPWLRLDNVSLIVAWSTPMVGTQCFEPPGSEAPQEFAPAAASTTGAAAPAVTSMFDRRDREQPAWHATAGESGAQTFAWASPIDLLDTRDPVLRFESRLSDGTSKAFVEVTRDGATWSRVAAIAPSDDWADVSVDLSGFAGDVVYVRFVYAGAEPLGGAPIETWAIRAVRVGARVPRTIQRFR